MRNFLMLLFAATFLTMLAFTIRASLEQSILNVSTELLRDKWFQATLVDAYLGFLTFYVWVAVKETRLVAKIGWFVAIMALGNMAMSAYVLLQLAKTRGENTARTVLLPTGDRTA